MPWFNSVLKLYGTLRNYLGLFGCAGPTVTKCYNQNTQYRSRTSVNNHVNNLLECLSFKCGANNAKYLQIRNSLAMRWKPDLMKQWNLLIQFSPMETQRLQNKSHITDKQFNTLAVAVNRALGRTLFASNNKKSVIRKLIVPRSASIFTIQLQKDGANKYDPRKHANFDVWYAQETEIMGKCLDIVVNKNEFVWMKQFANRIWFQIGADKATKGGFAESVVLIGPSLSVKDSMVSMYIPGQALESASNIVKCHQKMNYDKARYWESLSKQPVLVSTVLYHTTNGMLDSRLVQSCQVLINPQMQSMLNDNVNKQPSIKHMSDQVCQPQQFSYDWDLNKSANKQKKSGWEVALQTIKIWEKEYERPDHLSCLAECERQGLFDPTSMFAYRYAILLFVPT